ncbi:MAG: LysM peptidoglycan-binding domain-containing protein [Gammaproteobacteria bacterium]
MFDAKLLPRRLTRIAVTAAAILGVVTAVGQVNQSEIPVNPRHPDRYVVEPGDTLWDISGLFLQDPWYWPEIWQINPQVANPHLIYPGDILSLTYIDGQPVLQLERGIASSSGTIERLSPRVRVEQLEQAIPTIPAELVRAFLSRAAVVEESRVNDLPYIVALPEGLVGSAGQDVYVRGTSEPVGAIYDLIHLGDELVDPDTGEVLGYQGLYVGEGRISRTGDPATLALMATTREARRGDYLLEIEEIQPANYFPRAPGGDIEGRIISVINGLSLVGQYQAVVLNRGAIHGLENGHVLRAFTAGRIVEDEVGESQFRGELVQLPEEPAGTMMVFRVFDRMSYALVMEATSDIHVLDVVRNP